MDRGDDSKVLFLGYDNKAKLRHECKWAYSVKNTFMMINSNNQSKSYQMKNLIHTERAMMGEEEKVVFFFFA